MFVYISKVITKDENPFPILIVFSFHFHSYLYPPLWYLFKISPSPSFNQNFHLSCIFWFTHFWDPYILFYFFFVKDTKREIYLRKTHLIFTDRFFFSRNWISNLTQLMLKLRDTYEDIKREFEIFWNNRHEKKNLTINGLSYFAGGIEWVSE